MAEKCYKKIRKILCKLQDQERIRTVSYDDGSNTIAVAGPFDPHKLSCRIRCMGGKVIKGIEIMHDGGGGGCGGCRPEKMAGPQQMNNGKKKHKEKPREMQPPPGDAEQPPPENPPADPQPAHPSDSHISAGPPMIEDMKPKERPAELEPRSQQIDFYPAAPPVEKERPRERLPPPPPSAAKPVWPVDMTPSTVEIPSWPAMPASAGPEGHCGCSCCPPCYRGYYEGCRCCSCGRVYGYAVGVLPPPAGCYAGGYRPGCHLLSEEDPASACTIM